VKDVINTDWLIMSCKFCFSHLGELLKIVF